MTRFVVEAATSQHAVRLIALFEAAATPCFCRYWHFRGTKNDWLERCALRPEENAAELREAIASGRPDGRGVVAIDGGATGAPVVGWMKLVPRDTLPKLRSLPVYRSLDLGDGVRTHSIGCFLVRPDRRGQGVARALLAAAPELARSWGATALEAYPRRASETLYPEEVWQGPERLFPTEGFVVTHDASAYPVYRRALDRR